MLGGSEPSVMIRTRSSGWCWIILEFETGLAEFQCHVMCELYYRQNQVEQTDLAINPNPPITPPVATSHGDARANVLLHQSTRPDSRASHACDREVVSLATHALFLPFACPLGTPIYARINPTPSTAVQCNATACGLWRGRLRLPPPGIFFSAVLQCAPDKAMLRR